MRIRDITSQNFDIFEGNSDTRYTAPFKNSDAPTQVTYGDGHGNGLLMTDIVRLNQFLNISKKDYQDLTEIYVLTASEYAPTLAMNAESLDDERKKEYERRIKAYKKALLDFAAIMDRSTVKSKPELKRLFRSLGDLFSDRGANDLFTLALIFKLFSSDLSVENLLGNHDQVFLYHWAKNFKYREHNSIDHNQSVSYAHLYDLMKHGLVSKEAVNTLIENYYLPTLRLISYSTSDEPERSISLFTHAPVANPLEIVQSLAQHYFPGEDCSVHTREEVTALIDKINAKFLEIIMGKNGKDEFIKIQEEFLDPKLRERSVFRLEKEEPFYKAISQASENFHTTILSYDNIPSDQEKIQKLFEALKINYPKEGKTKKNLKAAFTKIADKFPKPIYQKFSTALNKIFDAITEIGDFEKAATEILSDIVFGFIPLELIVLILGVNPKLSQFDLKTIFDNLPKILENKHEGISEFPLTQAILFTAQEIYGSIDEFKKYEKEYQSKTHELNYDHAPFAPLLWEHFRERPNKTCPEKLGDGTLLYSVHGHDSPNNPGAEKNRFDLNSTLGFTANKIVENENVRRADRLVGFNHDTLSNHTSLNSGKIAEKVGPAKAYINSDKHPTEPKIVTEHRNIMKKLDVYRPLCEHYAETLHVIEDLEFDKKHKELKKIGGLEKKVNTLLSYTSKPPQSALVDNNPVQIPEASARADLEPVQIPEAPARADLVPVQIPEAPTSKPEFPAPEKELIESAKKISTSPFYEKHLAVFSLLDPLWNPTLKPAEQLQKFDAQFQNAEITLSPPRDYLPQHPKFAIFLMVSLTIVTGLLAGLVILGLIIHSKIKRNSCNILRSNGAIFSENIKNLEGPHRTLQETLFNH